MCTILSYFLLNFERLSYSNLWDTHACCVSEQVMRHSWLYICMAHGVVRHARWSGAPTWKWGLETHLASCLKRGAITLWNSAGSITSRISSNSLRNITWGQHTYKHIIEVNYIAYSLEKQHLRRSLWLYILTMVHSNAISTPWEEYSPMRILGYMGLTSYIYMSIPDRPGSQPH